MFPSPCEREALADFLLETWIPEIRRRLARGPRSPSFERAVREIAAMILVVAEELDDRDELEAFKKMLRRLE